ncbi:MAG TPA: hypothetical protein VFO76_05970 [Candidatus Kapabacteria bacterium]|nr:hypothetical protein [Candidatus Kapabacteria bacterium]
MKNLLLCMLLVSFGAVVGCSNDSTTNTGNGGGGGNATDYMPVTNGSSWHYATPTGTVTRTVSGTSTYFSKTFIDIDGTDGNTYSYRGDTNILYFITPKNDSTAQESIFLNTVVGSTWSYDMEIFTIPIHVTCKTVAAGLTRKVNGKDYSDVLQIQNSVSSLGATGSIDIYFAKGVGEIETVDPSGDKSETLTEYEIK